MGLSLSKSTENSLTLQQSNNSNLPSEEVANNLYHANNNKYLTTLDYSDLKRGKRELPFLDGGMSNNSTIDSYNDIRFTSNKNRYAKYNIFKIISKLENNTQLGGNDEENQNTTLATDDNAIQHIKELISKELNNSNNSSQVGAGCGCDTELKGGAKAKKTKATKAKGKKTNKKKVLKTKNEWGNMNNSSSSSSSSSSNDDTSSSSSSSSSLSSVNKKSSVNSTFKKTESLEKSDNNVNKVSDSTESDNTESNDESASSNEDESVENGLSIFPFNSSEVNSSASEKHLTMLRRKI